jgi:hypothetical protein
VSPTEVIAYPLHRTCRPVETRSRSHA